MKKKILLFMMVILAFAMASCDGDALGEERMPTLVGTKWKLEGIVDTETGELKILEPKDCEECYTLQFDSDSLLSGKGCANILRGRYNSNYTTSEITIVIWASTEINQLFDEKLYIETLNTEYEFSLQENKLMLHYNNNKNYFHFKILEEL